MHDTCPYAGAQMSKMSHFVRGRSNAIDWLGFRNLIYIRYDSIRRLVHLSVSDPPHPPSALRLLTSHFLSPGTAHLFRTAQVLRERTLAAFNLPQSTP